MGRGIYTKRDFKKTELIMVENPICIVDYNSKGKIHSFDSCSHNIHDEATLEITQKLLYYI